MSISIILKYSIAVYYILATAEASTNLARFDGIRYGVRSARAKTLDEVYDFSKQEGFGPEVKNRILLGTYVLSSGYQDAYYKKAQQVRTLDDRAIQESFQNASDRDARPPLLPLFNSDRSKTLCKCICKIFIRFRPTWQDFPRSASLPDLQRGQALRPATHRTADARCRKSFNAAHAFEKATAFHNQSLHFSIRRQTHDRHHTNWETVIGLEIHAQLNTKSKLFSSAPNRFGDEPNTNITEVCTGQPGALPSSIKRPCAKPSSLAAPSTAKSPTSANSTANPTSIPTAPATSRSPNLKSPSSSAALSSQKSKARRRLCRQPRPS